MNRHRAAGTLVLLASACTVGRTSSGDPAASRAVAAAMEHYTALIKAVASDSIAAMYTEDGDDGKVVVDSASTVSDDVEIFGTTAYQWGSFSQVARVQDQPPGKFSGRYVARWRRTPEGQWKLTRLLMQPAPSSAQ
jgi:hypothetical protein